MSGATRSNADAGPEQLRRLIRDVPDFPRPGILFRDVTPLLSSAAAFAQSIELMARPFRDQGVAAVVGAESRGFIFGSAVARLLGAGFVPARKPGKLPWKTRRHEYALEYGTDALELHADAVPAGARVLVVDDLLATGGTLVACDGLIQGLGADVVGFSVLIELAALGGRAALRPGVPVHSVLVY